jgi:tRNA threonylcarbamoyladenosine biosynthesis protein TsaB
MLILSIDTTSASGSVALLRDLEVAVLVASTEAEPYSSRLFRDVARVLREAGIAMQEMDLFAVASGPGSFTGVRVGLAAVKAWAEVYRRPVAAVSALEAIASQASANEALAAGISDAHRGHLFAGLYERTESGLRRRGDDVVMPPAECFAYLAEHAAGARFVIRTTAPEIVRAALADSAATGAPVETADPALAPAIGRLGYARAQRGELTDALTLDAHYVRRSDAELLWHDR